MAVQFVQPHRFSADQYRRMTEIGLVPEHGTELVDGVVVAGTRPFRFSSEDYFRLGREGILDEDDRVELVDGEVSAMRPVGPRHSKCVARLIKLLGPRVGEAELRIQDVLRLNEDLTNHPDAAVYPLRAGEFESEQPTAAEALLVVEVTDSSLLYDRTIKMERYAEGGIPEYWLVDLKRNAVIVARNPVGMQYLDVREYRQGDRWTSPAITGGDVHADEVLGPERG